MKSLNYIEGLDIDFSNYLNWDLPDEQENIEKLVRFLYKFETITSQTKYGTEPPGGAQSMN